MYDYFKSWFLSALFFVSVTPTAVSAADIQNLSAQQTWLLLIHSWEEQAQIKDAKFLLSAAQFSAESELQLTLDEYQIYPSKTFCRFPARMTYLAQQLNFDLPADRFEKCPELNSFLHHVPFDSLELVYASEVLSSASSMMGHVFIKASGLNSRQRPVAHSLAYYTEITTINPLKLVVESTITGMPGFFSVRPFAKDVEQYIEKEQRNLWQFGLHAAPDRLHLLQLHIWELNQINITYYFQSFNCATLTLEMLALLKPALLQHRSIIVSPADVVKAVVSEDMVLATDFNTAPHWLFHAFRGSIDRGNAREVDELIFARPAVSNEEKIARLNALAINPLTARYITVAAERAKEKDVLDRGFSVHVESKPVLFDFSNYKHPARTPQDSALGVSWVQDERSERLLLHYLPAGHFLTSDNRQYLSESELIIAKATVAVIPDQKRIQLEEFTLYSMRSISPDHTAFPVLSGEFYLGYRSGYTQTLQPDSVFELSGAVGKSRRLQQDIIGYAMAGGGLATEVSNSQAFFYIKTGVLIDLIADAKFYLQYETNTGKTKSPQLFEEVAAVLSWFPDKNHAVSFKLNHIKNKRMQKFQLGAEYFYHF